MMTKLLKTLFSNLEKLILWAIYLSLLGVLLPHTAWAFEQFEPAENRQLAWAAAFAFEAIVAMFTHLLARHIEHTPNYKDLKKRWRVRYLNAYGGGLFAALIVSFLANLTHAVQFGNKTDLIVLQGQPLLFGVYALAFGGILPISSLLFARVLSSVQDIEPEDNPELRKLNEAFRAIKQKLTETERQLQATERRATEAERRYTVMGDVVVKLFGENKQERILAARQQWPGLPLSGVAVIADVSKSYVHEVLNGD